MKQYRELLSDIIVLGNDRGDRTGTGTRSIFGHQMRFDLERGFPLLGLKRTPFKAIAHELLWFLSGSTNIRYLQENGVTIWDEWADEHGELGPVYGKQWRSWDRVARDSEGSPFVYPGETIDQITEAIRLIREDPNSRRILVSAWNVGELDEMALAPCHAFFQFYVNNGRLSLQSYQRSADVFLGVPFNIASYALLIHMVAHITGLRVGELIWTGGDCHLYSNTWHLVPELLSREDRPLPRLTIGRDVASIDDFKIDDFIVEGYDPWPAIRAEVAV